jgi:hypothetical protein
MDEHLLDFPKFRASQMPIQLPSSSVDCNAERESVHGAQRRLGASALLLFIATAGSECRASFHGLLGTATHRMIAFARFSCGTCPACLIRCGLASLTTASQHFFTYRFTTTATLAVPGSFNWPVAETTYRMTAHALSICVQRAGVMGSAGPPFVSSIA